MRRRLRSAVGVVLLLSCFAPAVLARRHPDAPEPTRSKSVRVAVTGGTLNGRVVDDTGMPLQNIEVWLARTSDRVFVFGMDDYPAADGTFTISGIADGDYFLNAFPIVPTMINLDTWYPDVWDFDFHTNLRSATPIRFAGNNTMNLEIRLPRGTRFSFELRDGGAQLIDLVSQHPNCSVGNFINLGTAYSDSGITPIVYPITFNCQVFTRTAPGRYAFVPIPVGRKLWMEFWPDGTDFLPVTHDGKRGVDGSTPLVASGAGEVTIPVTLSARGPSITGFGRFQFTNITTVLQRTVRLYTSANQLIRVNSLGADGSGSLGGMPDGDYKVQYFVRGRIGTNPALSYAKFWQNAQVASAATPIQVRGQNVTGINVFLDTPPDILQVGGEWSGTYSDSIACGATTFSSSGPASFNLTQTGNTITGTLTLFDRKNISGSCAASGTTTIVGTVNGSLNGGAFNGTVAATLGNLPLTGTFSTGSFSGTLTYLNGTSALSMRSGAAARIESFAATPAKIRLGEASTLSWKILNATTVSISNISTTLAPSGSLEVRPTATTTYTLTAGTSSTPPTAQAIVEVVALPAVSVATLPDALLQVPNGTLATTSYTLINSGGAPASVTLGQSAGFFTQEPASFTIPAGGTQIVTIRGTSQLSGTYEGTSMPSGDGVRAGLAINILLLVAEAPTGTATADTERNRVDISAPPTTQEPAGEVVFTNSGSATLTGILSSDVPWITFDNPAVTIPAGGSATVTFTIDRTQRPDAEAPIGSVSGTLRLSYQTTSAAGKLGVMNGGSVSTSTTVTIVDTAKPPTNLASLTKLAPGEVARFVPRVAHLPVGNSVIATDVTVSRSTGTATVSDLRLFYVPSATPQNALIANLGALAPSQSLLLGNVVSSIFSKQSEIGSLQLRSADWDKIALQARSIDLAARRAGLGQEVPVFRSDRAAGAGESLTFTALRRNATTEATLYLQESSGSPASISIDFLDANGTVVGTEAAKTIPPFALLELANAIPPGAVTAIVRISETSGGQVVGYASMTDTSSADSWTVTDWARYFGYKNSDAVRVPLVESSPRRRRGSRRSNEATSGAARTELALFNPGTSAVSATVAFTNVSGQTVSKSVSIDSRKTVVASDVVAFVGGSGRGSVVITPNAPLVIGASVVAGSGARYNATVPALASSAGLRLGDVLAFANLEDATAKTVQARTPGTLRTGFGIVETLGAPVTVRATLTYADGSTPVAATLARDFAVGARASLTFDAIAAAIIGPSREVSVGDLRNLRASFQVISGDGAATIFVRSTESASGDSIVRVE